MSKKYEIKTLVQSFTGVDKDYDADPVDDVTFAPPMVSRVILADKDLTKHVNDGWKILNITVIENLAFDPGEGGSSWPQRIVTLRRKVKSPLVLKWESLSDLVKRIDKKFGVRSDAPMSTLVGHWRNETLESDDLLKALEAYRSDMTPKMLLTFEMCLAAQSAYEASLQEEEDL